MQILKPGTVVTIKPTGERGVIVEADATGVVYKVRQGSDMQIYDLYDTEIEPLNESGGNTDGKTLLSD